MSGVNINLDAGDFAQLADFWERAPDITRTRLMQAMTAVDADQVAHLKQNLPRGAAGAAGLAGSVTSEEQALDDAVIGITYSQVDYAVYVELGTKPHFAPIQPLIDWVKGKMGLLDESARSVAFAIRGAIAKRGTKAQPVWQTTFAARAAYRQQVFDAAMVAIARDLAGGAL
ncbi:MAG: hypothetical protein J0I77_09330 [Rudaea sp.]|uniref:hypothetical protein n=1 Tax=unclassified Rudaea TaxID=2627037 RepID=UPI0010F950C7|nr:MULTISPECIES: hypothetical protein [unclassified Rudaea]MBN8885908.1 hypothetical protein [Rudaea sp.]MBR0346981.1 hypothetical protein [Rudaea sp.]